MSLLKKITLLCGLFLLATVASFAKPVTWTWEVKKTGNNEYDLIFRAKITPGVHVYSQHIGNDGPVPTSFTFKKADGYKLVGDVAETSTPIKVHDKAFDMDLVYFMGTAEFVQHVKITGDTKTITGSFEYMACDDVKCFPPETIDFEFDLTK